jgi:vacuolar-type H+-ATPase subunit I/STV1
MIERGVIYGLFSYLYLNQTQYLDSIELTDLTNMLTNYNNKIADLTTQEQVLVANIVSKRYLAGIDKFIHDQKMATKSAAISADDAMWTAKIAALASDREVLDTLAMRVVTETVKTNARISELQAYISMESVNLSEVDVQVAEKEIQSAKLEVSKLDAENEILRIQTNTVGAATKLVDVDLQIARTRVDLAQTDSNMAKIGLLDSELSIEQSRTTVSEAEASIAASRVDLAENKAEDATESLDYHRTTLIEQTETELTNKIALMNTNQDGKENLLDQRTIERTLQLDTKTEDAALDVHMSDNDTTSQESIDAYHLSVLGNRVWNRHNEIEAAVAATEKLLAATITTNLTHTIKKAK